jgi:hypothetical protein
MTDEQLGRVAVIGELVGLGVPVQLLAALKAMLSTCPTVVERWPISTSAFACVDY